MKRAETVIEVGREEIADNGEGANVSLGMILKKDRSSEFE